MLCQGAAPRSDHSSTVSKITSYLPTPSMQIKQLWSGHILVRFRVVTSGKFTSHVLLLAHAQSPCSQSFLFPLDNNAESYQLGMATPLPMAPQAGTLRNFQLWETSHRKPALIILLRGEELASFSLQNRRKRKRALESHRKVNTNFLSPGSFRWSWEGPLGCLSPRLCSTMSNKARGSGLSL